jgi:aspartate-semialdehyde dehydrogenase
MGSTGMRLAVAGATGLVGQELLRIIQAQGPKIGELGLYASSHSAGQVQHWLDREWTVRDLAQCDFAGYDLAFFCIGDELSAKFVPEALAAGCAVIDKSNAFRLDPAVPLVVSGVNDAAITAESKLVANPNCSTIILTHALAPLLNTFGLDRVWVATYQSVSGAGNPGVQDLSMALALAGEPSAMLEQPELPPGSFAYNVVPGIGLLDRLGRCSEEAKLVDETCKILAKPSLPMITHAARVPVVVGHSMAVTVELSRPAAEAEIIAAWRAAPDVRFLGELLPEPISSARLDQVEAGRLRSEPQLRHGWSFFISGNNLRLGAALNGWRIMRLMLDAGVIPQATFTGGPHA